MSDKCPKCGKEKDRDGYLCSSCLEKKRKYQRETRQFLREMRICLECRKNRLLGDEKYYCLECRVKKAEYNKKAYMTHKDEIREKQKEFQKIYYRQRKEKGICCQCGKIKTVGGKAKCYVCLRKNVESKKKKHDKDNRSA